MSINDVPCENHCWQQRDISLWIHHEADFKMYEIFNIV